MNDDDVCCGRGGDVVGCGSSQYNKKIAQTIFDFCKEKVITNKE